MFSLIQQDKVRTMIQLAIFEKNMGRKALKTTSFALKDYIRFQMLKTAIYVTIVYVMIVGLAILKNIESLIDRFGELNYGMLIGGLVLGYVVLMVFYLFHTYRQSRDEYREATPQVEEYGKYLKWMEEFYEKEDLEQRQFEKGQWRNG